MGQYGRPPPATAGLLVSHRRWDAPIRFDVWKWRARDFAASAQNWFLQQLAPAIGKRKSDRFSALASYRCWKFGEDWSGTFWDNRSTKGTTKKQKKNTAAEYITRYSRQAGRLSDDNDNEIMQSFPRVHYPWPDLTGDECSFNTRIFHHHDLQTLNIFKCRFYWPHILFKIHCKSDYKRSAA